MCAAAALLFWVGAANAIIKSTTNQKHGWLVNGALVAIHLFSLHQHPHRQYAVDANLCWYFNVNDIRFVFVLFASQHLSLSLSLPFVSFIIPFGAVAFMLFHFDVEKNENMKRSVEMPHCKSLPFFHLNSTQSPPKRKHPGGRVRISHSFFKIHCLL